VGPIRSRRSVKQDTLACAATMGGVKLARERALVSELAEHEEVVTVAIAALAAAAAGNVRVSERRVSDR
jgi:hypothetical protein